MKIRTLELTQFIIDISQDVLEHQLFTTMSNYNHESLETLEK